MTWPSTLFVDQTGQLGGAELCLFDLASRWEGRCAVLTFEDGPFPERLRSAGVDVRTLGTAMKTRKDSSLRDVLRDFGQTARSVRELTRVAADFDVISANTRKATVAAAVAGRVSRTPFVAQLHDLLTPEHFSSTNLTIATQALRRADMVVADSVATADAWTALGGDPDRTEVVYYGFDPSPNRSAVEIRAELDVDPAAFLVGHFGRISPWKGQRVLLEALSRAPGIVAILAGAPLFGERSTEVELHRLVRSLGIEDRVSFLGFRDDVPDLMAACDLTVHSSVAPEPFGRVIVESMLVGTPVIAADAGGPREIIHHGVDGWLAPPGDADALAEAIIGASADRQRCRHVGATALTHSQERFGMDRYVQHMRAIHEQVADAR